jgi:glutaredoxin 3
MQLTVHSKTDCPWCVRAKAALAKHHVPYTEIVHDQEDERQGLYAQLAAQFGRPVKTVPQIVLKDGAQEHLIGGHDDLINSGLLQSWKALAG